MRASVERASEKEEEKFYAKIGKLAMEKEFLSNVLGRDG